METSPCGPQQKLLDENLCVYAWPTAILQYAKNSSPALSKVAVAFTGALSMVLGNFADSHLPVSFFWQETLEVKW